MTQLQAGWYGIRWTLGTLAHSFVGTDDGSPVWFDCYGGHIDTYHRNYPYISGTGNLRYARALTNLQPNSSKAEYNGWFDSCGILYGINGVCHQMTNRTLWATDKKLLLQAQPGYSLSHWFYGHYGNVITFNPVILLIRNLFDEICKILGIPPIDNLSWLSWLGFAEIAMKKASNDIPSMSFEEFVRSSNDATMNLELLDEYSPEVSARRFMAFISQNSQVSVNDATLPMLTDSVRQAATKKMVHDSEFFSGSLSIEQYCERVNAEVNTMLNTFAGNVSDEDYKNMLNLHKEDVYNLVDPTLMAHLTQTG